MILPLQTWQHQDPKGLWPALGGLAVLAHIGVIGMSVPYLLSLREAEAQNTAIAIPIELSVEPSANSASVDPAVEHDKPAVSDSQAVVKSAIAPNQEASFSARSPTVESLDSESSAPPESASEQPDRTAEDQEASASDEVNENNENIANAEETETTENESTAATPEDPSQSITASSENPLPTIKGKPLTDPAAGGDRSTSPQISPKINIVGDLQYKPGQDIPITPPELIDWGDVARAEDCGTVGAQVTQSSLVYRMRVNLEDGSVEAASFVSSQGIEPSYDEDRVIACLIKKIGIKFRPTVFNNNDQKLDDSWLMTVELSEQ